MVHLITEISKYLMIILFACYTIFSFTVLRQSDGSEKADRIYRKQTICMFLIHLDANLVIYLAAEEQKQLIFYVFQVLYLIFVLIIFKRVYHKSAKLLVNHMCMLMVIGFIILTRLDFDKAVRQFEIACIAAVVTIFVPLIIRKMKMLRNFTWLYAGIGIAALLAVYVIGQVTYGAKLSFTIGSITLQPSEFIKIVFVFFVACALREAKEFKQIVVITAAAAVHVLILVLSTDLGAALIFFVTYVVMLYVATQDIRYFLSGIGLGVIAWLAAARIFTHVQERITAWKDPFAVIDDEGYQVAHSLFAIGTGSWFGTGLYQGMPDKIPVAESDFVFAAISEEMGGLFALCIIVVCFSCYLMTLNIAMQIHDIFYKLIALGLGTVYGTQVFLCIGGVTKCIPSTGVTLPFISYGGSSLFCTMIMFAVIQGLYILRQDEGEINVKKQQIPESEKKRVGEHTGDRGDDRSGNRRYSGEGKKEKQTEDIEELW